MSSRAAAAHTLIAFGSAIVVCALAFSALQASTPTDSPVVQPVDIGIEHSGALLIRIRLTKDRSPGLLDISHDSTKPITLHLPSSWIQREVLGVPVHAISSTSTEVGYTQYVVPSGAALSFTIDVEPQQPILVHNASSTPLSIRYETVSIESDTIERDVRMVQEGSILLE